MRNNTEDYVGSNYATVREMRSYIQRNPLDSERDSHQLIRQLERNLDCNINLSTLVLAALFNGYIVVPSAGSFRFMKL